MKQYFAFAVYAALISNTSLATKEPIPKIEQSIYKAAPPFQRTKLSIYVRERERPLLPLIEDASTSIARFLLDIYAFDASAVPVMRQVLPEARDKLRLPPVATVSDVEGAQRRFVDSYVYCWRSDNRDQLRFLIEWADFTTKTRYTDSYVFVRQGWAWFFQKHDTIAPLYWTQTQRYFQRTCPRETG